MHITKEVFMYSSPGQALKEVVGETYCTNRKVSAVPQVRTGRGLDADEKKDTEAYN